MRWLRFVSGDHGIWSLPDGRKVFYPFGWGRRGYLLPSEEQVRRVRWKVRAITVVLWVPGVFVLHADDAWIVAAYVVAAGLLHWVTVKWMFRGLAQVDEPMSPLRALRLKAPEIPAPFSAFCCFLCLVLGALVVVKGVAAGAFGWGLVAGVVFLSVLAFSWAYMWWVKLLT
jgi:hypothetical protein